MPCELVEEGKVGKHPLFNFPYCSSDLLAAHAQAVSAARRRRPLMASRLARLSTVLALAVATPCCCAFHAAPLLPRLHNRCRRSRTATMREPPDVARAIKEEEEECDIERLAAPWACNMDSIIDRAIDRATAETSQKNIINGRLGELKLGASDWMWIYRRWHGTWKPRPVWPASAAQAAD